MKSLIIQTAVCSCTSAVQIAAKHFTPTREEKNPEHRRLNHLFSPSTSKPTSKQTSKPTSLSSSSKPSTAKPTSQNPTTFKPLLQRPTSSKPVGSSSKQPTLQPATSQPTLVPQPASWPTARLKIYWQTDYKWQDFATDPLYCMDCWDNICVAGDFIKMAHCSTAHDQLFYAINGTIRPALNTSLCFTIMGYGDDLDTDGRTISTPIQLQPCLDNTWNQPVMNQTFLSQPRVGDGFNLIPTSNNRRCLAQLHHPKSGEKVFPRSCVDARFDTTGSWVTY